MKKFLLLFAAILSVAFASAEVIKTYTVNIDNLIINVDEEEGDVFVGYVQYGKDCVGDITIPNSVEVGPYNVVAPIIEINGGSFQENTKLTGITTQSNLRIIWPNSFMDCTHLVNVNLNKEITQMGYSVFQGCTSLERIILDNNVTDIRDNFFQGCSNLSLVFLPRGLTSNVPATAFNGCDKLHVIYNFSRKNIAGLSESVKVINYPYVIHNGYNDITSYASNDEAVAKLESEDYAGTNALYYNFGSTSGAGMESVTNGAWNAANGWQANNIELVDAKPIFVPFDIQASQITYTRPVVQGIWQPLYLPFSIAYTDWCKDCDIAELYNVHLREGSNGADDKIVLEFQTVKSGSINPNVPYLFKPKTGVTSITFTGRNTTLTATPSVEGSVYCQSTRERFTLRGVYEVKEGLYAMNAYAMGPNGTFVLAESADQKLAPFRIYLTIENIESSYSQGQPTNGMPKRIIASVDGEELDGIDDIEADEIEGSQPAYDMFGRKVAEPKQGLYIKGGKKVIMK